MKIRFLADEDLDLKILRALRMRESAIDILDAKQSGLRKTNDDILLELPAMHGRLLIFTIGAQ